MVIAKKTRGRQKVAMVRMEKESNRLVTFSKRRPSVFKIVSELCTLCGAQALCIVFSPAKKAFAFGHPSVDAIMDRFLLEDNHLPNNKRVLIKELQNEVLVRSNMEVSRLKDKIDVERKRAEELLKERKSKSKEALKYLEALETRTFTELQQMQATLIGLRISVCTHANSLVEAQMDLSLKPTPTHLLLAGQNSLGPNILGGQNHDPNPNPTLIQTHIPPTLGDHPTQMTMRPPTLMRRLNENPPMMMMPTPTNAFNDPASTSNPFPPTAMGWNPIPGDYQPLTSFSVGESSPNSSAPPSNPQSTYIGSNPILGGYPFFTNMTGKGSSYYTDPSNPQGGGYMGSNPIPSDYRTFTNLISEGSSNYSATPFNPQSGYMGSNPIPGDHQASSNMLMGEGRLDPSVPHINPQGGFGPGTN